MSTGSSRVSQRLGIAAATLAAFAQVPVPALAAAGADRLWVQVTPSCTASAPPKGYAPSGVISIIGGFAGAAFGSLLEAIGNRIKADATYTLKASLAYEPAFAWFAPGKNGTERIEYLGTCVTLSVGTLAVPLVDANGALSYEQLIDSPAFKSAPVFVQWRYEASQDRTAIAPRLVHWKYDHFLDPDAPPFRASERSVTFEVKVGRADGNDLLTTLQQFTGSEKDIAGMAERVERAQPPYDALGPWASPPTLSPPSGWPAGTPYGPVNVTATLVELAPASGFAKIFAAGLSAESSDLQALVTEQVKLALDPAARAQARLALLTGAQSARTQYETAYKAAQDAITAYCSDHSKDPTVALSIYRANETLARQAMDNAHVPFVPLPPLAVSC